MTCQKLTRTFPQLINDSSLLNQNVLIAYYIGYYFISDFLILLTQ